MTGLVLEGGASRTVYSCGILDALLEENIKADYVIGVSAGAAFGASYVSGQIGRNYRLAREIMPTKKYMGFHHLLRPSNKSYYNLDYAFDEVPNSVLPFDYDAYNDYKGRFVAVVTNVETGKAEYLDVPRDDRSWQLLRATCALPMLFPMIRINGVNYLDGGVSDSIPYKQAIAEGCDKLIIVLTRPKGYIKETDTAAKLSADFFKKYPDFAEAEAHFRGFFDNGNAAPTGGPGHPDPGPGEGTLQKGGGNGQLLHDTRSSEKGNAFYGGSPGKRGSGNQGYHL